MKRWAFALLVAIAVALRAVYAGWGPGWLLLAGFNVGAAFIILSVEYGKSLRGLP